MRNKLLLVEDEVLIALAEKMELEKYGYDVIHVMSGEKAITFVAENNDIDLILMDINLNNELDGTNAAEIILQNHDIPIVFVSSHTDPETVRKTEKITSYGYVVKSSSITVLDASIKMAFKLHEANKHVQESEEQVRIILNAAGEGIYGLDLNGTTTFVNPAAAKMIGWEQRDIIGKNQHKLLHHSRADGTPYPSGECPIYAAYKDGDVHHVDDEVFWRKDGSSFPVDYISSPIRDKQGNLEGAVVTFKDITESRQAKNKLLESEEKYRNLFEKESDAIFIYDPDTTIIIDANDATSEMYGYEKDELIGMSCLKLSAEVKESSSSLEKMQDSRDSKMNVPLRFHKKKDGTIFPVDISGHKITLGGKDVMFAVSKDITERNQAEKEIKMLSQMPSENPNPVLRINQDGTILYANKSSNLLLQTWKCSIGENLPTFLCDLVLDIYKDTKVKEIDVEAGDQIYSLVIVPIVDEGLLNIYGRDITGIKELS